MELEPNAEEVYISIKNLPSLTNLSFHSFCVIDENFVTKLLQQVTHIQKLLLEGNLCYFNLDSLVNLRVLSLSGYINKKFNFQLFKNLCNQLEDIKISLTNIDEQTLFKLFDGYNFPYLVDFCIEFLYMKRLKREFIDRLPIHRKLKISLCKIEVIESDSFSNMQQLTSLNLSNNQIELIEKNAFLKLKSLETLDLSKNRLRKFDRNFIGLGNSVKVNIENNNITV